MFKMVVPYPPSANRYWRISGNRLYVSGEAMEYKDTVGELALGIDDEPIKGDVVLYLDVYRPRKAGDLSNRIKVLEDALQGICYDDDAQVVEIHARRFDDKKNPRVEVTACKRGEHADIV